MSRESNNRPEGAVFVDAHAHILEEPVAAKNLIDQCVARGIGFFLLGGYDPDDWDRQARLRKVFGARIQMSFGLHPWFVHNASEDECVAAFGDLTRRMAARKSNPETSPFAIGETGLDHALATRQESKNRQMRWFKEHLRLAAGMAMPVVLHVVKAHGKCLDAIHEHQGISGLVHAFRGERSLILEYAKSGLLVSIGPNGVAGMSREDLRSIPDENLVIESDAPTGAITARERGGSLVTPLAILDVAEKVAAARDRQESAVDILHLSRRNLVRVFGPLPDNS